MPFQSSMRLWHAQQLSCMPPCCILHKLVLQFHPTLQTLKKRRWQRFDKCSRATLRYPGVSSTAPSLLLNICKLHKVDLADAYKNEQKMQDIFRCLLSLLLASSCGQHSTSLWGHEVTAEQADAIKGTAADTAVVYVGRQWLRKHDGPCTAVCVRQPAKN